MSFHNNPQFHALRGKHIFVGASMIVVFLISFVISGGFFFTDLNTEIRTIDIVQHIPYDAEKIPLTPKLLMQHQEISLYERGFDIKIILPFVIGLTAAFLTGVLLLAYTRTWDLTPVEKAKVNSRLKVYGILLAVSLVLMIGTFTTLIILRENAPKSSATSTPPSVKTVTVDDRSYYEASREDGTVFALYPTDVYELK